MTPIPSFDKVRPTKGQERALRTVLRSLLGKFDFDRLCLGMKVGGVDDEVLEVLVPAESCAADIKLHHLEDISVAAEYALGQPVRTVNVLSKD